MIINLLKKFLLGFKNNYNNYIYNLKLMSIEFYLILFNIEKRFIINNNILINISNIKYIFRI